jgi:hypothetical protein
LGAAHENALKDSLSVNMMAEVVSNWVLFMKNALKDRQTVNMTAEEVSDWVLLMKMH